MPSTSALVLFSGGQDSTVCLAWALERYAHVETVGFDYGQRHAVELAQRKVILDAIRSDYPQWAARLGDDHVLSLTELGRLSETALTRDAEIEMTSAGLPSTFVPGRNLLFFTYAAALGYRRGIRTLIGGMCETDYSGYPDCRNETLRALENAISLGMDSLRPRDAADVARQGRDLADGPRPRRRAARRPHRRAYAHLLPRRPQTPPPLGLRLRHLPCVRASGEGVGQVANRQDLKRGVELALAGDWDGAHAIAQRG